MVRRIVFLSAEMPVSIWSALRMKRSHVQVRIGNIPFPAEQYLVIPVDVTGYHKDAMRKP